MKNVLAKLAGGLLAAALLTGTLSAPARAQNKTLYLFNWQDYIGAGLIKAFEAHCGCKVVQTYYDFERGAGGKAARRRRFAVRRRRAVELLHPAACA